VTAVAPPYVGLQLGATTLRIFAVLYHCAAAIAVALGVVVLVNDPETPFSQDASVIGFIFFIGWALFAAMIGALLHAASAGCDALRDIARNSFAR
jgi:hypothetical protein